jgi:SAM-dependent methyltransferase
MTNPCRFCARELTHTFVDLGAQPIANDLIAPSQEGSKEPFYPLHIYVCDHCWLVQSPTVRREHEIFTDHYPYFSSFSSSWLAHAKAYVEMMVARFGLRNDAQVIELASNDGYLLQYFKEQGFPVLGIEPTSNTAAAAMAKGIPTISKFFGADVAEELKAEGRMADVLLGNNVLAHVPDLNDFVAGMKILLKPSGVLTMEFPHLMQLMAKNQFDTIYHEHYSYYSMLTVQDVFARHGLTVFDVEEIPTHGGSLRVFAQHRESAAQAKTGKVERLKDVEIAAGLTDLKTYQKFGSLVEHTKTELMAFLKDLKAQGKTIVGYGAPAKGNTLINYCGIDSTLIDYTVDLSPSKQNHRLPGSRIPIRSPAALRETKPDYVFILPWNIKEEIARDHSYIKEWGGRFFTAIPKVEILP